MQVSLAPADPLHRRRAVHAVALALACAACVDGQPDPESQQTCEESELRILEISQDMISELASPCDVDADCEIVSVSADCPNGEPFGMPDEAIALGRLDEARPSWPHASATCVCRSGALSALRQLL